MRGKNLKKVAVSLVLCIGVVYFVFAGGKKEIDELETSSLDSWEESIDVSEKKTGKYNIMVTASDQGGNTTIAGPYNLYIDPESDFPTANITNPLTQQRVPGNLNIVGTCIDDDGVSKVELIFDGDEDNPKIADGTDFWSYYLDTTKMREGPHTIGVYGYDINGLKGHLTEITWNLDRMTPKTKVENHGTGELVSGYIHLKGSVFDGNGISKLWYSLDKGVIFRELKIRYDKSQKAWTFDLPINTKKMEDGPQVCWFKGLDEQGSYGVYSFLYFIDNTAPELQFIYPAPEVAVNGEFAIVGLVRDTVAMQSLSWEVGDSSGDFEIIPGDPYWTTKFDARDLGGKNCKISIIATDTVGNKTIEKRIIPFDFEADKPTITIESPLPDQQVYDDVYLRGKVFDDDGVASIIYSIDDGEEKTLVVDSVFSDVIIKPGHVLPFGNHTVTVTGVDVYGQKGNPYQVKFFSIGEKPVFADATIGDTKKKEAQIPYIYGMDVYPEDNYSIKTSVSSECYIQEVYWQFNNGVKIPLELNKPKETVELSIPLDDSPWGVSRLTIHAIDICNRETTKNFLLNITDLTKIHNNPEVRFSDSTISADNLIDFTKHSSVSGFFTGGQADSVELVPPNDFTTIKLYNNCITLKPGSNHGTSEPFIVRVTTDKGLTYDSKKLTVKTKTLPATLTINNKNSFDGFSDVNLNGKISSEAAIKSVKYRLLTSYMKAEDGTREVTSTSDTPFSIVKMETGTNTFALNLKAKDFPKGVSVIEIVVETVEGEKTVDSAFVSKIPELPTLAEGEKAQKPAKPLFDWIEGENLYYTCIYQGIYSYNDLLVNNIPFENQKFEQGGIIKKSDLEIGDNTFSTSILYGETSSAKTVYKYTKLGETKIEIQSVDNELYVSGMQIVLPAKSIKEEPHALLATVNSPYTISKATAALNGTSISANVLKTENPNSYTISVPLINVPAGINEVEVTAMVNKKPVSVRGMLSVLREAPIAGVDNREKIYWFKSSVFPSFSENNMLMKKGDEFSGYANLTKPVSVRLDPPIEGFTVSIDENVINVVATKDGFYSDVQVVATDRDGFTYKAPVFSTVVDSQEPIISVMTPKTQDWVKTKIDFSLNVTDANGIKDVSVSVDLGAHWMQVEKLISGDTFEYKTILDISDQKDGLIPVWIRAIDNANRQVIEHLVVSKDTIPPSANVIVPPVGEVVNGRTTIVFVTEDAGKIVDTTSFVGVLSDEDLAKAKAEATKRGSKIPQKMEPEKLDFSPVVKNKVGTEERPLSEAMQYQITDAAGNIGFLQNYNFSVNDESDNPKVEIHVPEAGAVVTSDFEISGVIYDDDGACRVWYALDDNGDKDTSEFKLLSDEYVNSYSIDIPLSVLDDNAHWVTIFAEDVYGIKGDSISIPFRVSLEEPKAAVLEPEVGVTVNDTATISGISSDKNGIEKVQISVDNGNTYNDAIGTEDWSYTFDTNIIEDGTHVFFIRVYDKYGIEGLYSSLINIDNTVPDLELDLPLDGSVSTGKVFFSGRTMDNIGLQTLSVSINSIGENKSTVPQDLSFIKLIPDDIITQVVDVSNLQDGIYNIELVGGDAAGNITRISRNIELDTSKPATVAELMYPLNGEHVNGLFNIYGRTESENKIVKVLLYIDEKMLTETEVTQSGYFKFELTPELLEEGSHFAQIRVLTEKGDTVASNIQTFEYSPTGPWVSIDNFCMGDFAFDRPFLEGSTGYALSERDVVVLTNKDASKEEKEEVKAKAIDRVDISFNNGKTFEKVGSSEKWHYRIENEDMVAGYHFLIVRSTMKNGQIATTRSILQIDKEAPVIKLVSPGEGGRYNQELRFAGLSSDDVELDSVMLALRNGDKSSYEVPSFIQGLYFDTHFFGATLYDIGLGLTFFDDNVKLQAQFGQLTQSQYYAMTGSTEELRYGGNVFGGKLIANVASVPFRYFFGPDWSWLSAAFGVGANFSYFTDTQSGEGQMLSAVLGQIEFPRVTIPKREVLSTLSFYGEMQVWFIPTDVTSSVEISSVVPQVSCGIRMNIF